MNNVARWFSQFKPTVKSAGSVLFVTLVLSGLLVSVGLGLAKILATEIRFSADLLFAEKAYYAAEAGVEIALLELEKEPVQHTVGSVIPLQAEADTTLEIGNLQPVSPATDFRFVLPPKGTTKLRLKKDTDPTLGVNLAAVENFDLEAAGGRFQWKIVCLDTGRTVAIQSVLAAGSFPDFASQTGVYDDPDGRSTPGTSVADFYQTFTNPADAQSCFLSFANLDEANPVTFTLAQAHQMSPHQATVRSVGQSGGRTKTIVFDYAQTNLSPLFDFGFYHTDKGF